MFSGEHDCLSSVGKALGEKDGEEVAETLEGSRVAGHGKVWWL